jgi:hypothetical protein
LTTDDSFTWSSPNREAKAKKRLVLVFPPLTMPTSPPLGVSMLKSYIERTVPDWEVIVVDLNLWCFQLLFKRLASGEMYIDLKAMAAAGINDVGTLLKAADVFSGRDNTAFYENPNLYDRLGSAFIGFTELIVRRLEQLCTEWEKKQQPVPILQDLVDRIVAERPDCVGISMIFSDQLPIGAMLGRYLRTELRLKVFFGGSCFTEGVDHFLEWYPQAADAIISGDGEVALARLLSNGGDPSSVAGAYFREMGEVKHNPPKYEENIDAFGRPDFSWADLHAYYSPEPVVPLLLSRGCYWRKCTFCVHYFSAGDTYRMHTLDSVIDMLTDFAKRGITNFSFVDEMIAPGHFAQLAKAIEAAGLEISYYALSKPSKTFTPKVLAEVARSGCKYLLWGVESGCQRVIDLMGKGTKVADIAEVLRNAQHAGIANHVYIISGFPTETNEEFAETLRFLDANKDNIYAIHRSIFGLEQGSPIMKAPDKFGIEKIWLKRDTPLGGRLGYRCSSGVTMEMATKNFQRALPFWRGFNPYAVFLANFRDHALLVYKKRAKELDPGARRFAEISEYRDASPSVSSGC